jgi:hypothetical protein
MAKHESKTEPTAELMWTTKDLWHEDRMHMVPVLLQKFTITFYVDGVFDREVDNWVEVPGTYNLLNAMTAQLRRGKGNGT